MKRFLLLGAISLLTACHSYETVNTSVYMDSSRPTKERVEALLRQITLDEKIGQMDMVSEWDEQAIFDKGYYNFGAWICGQSLEKLNKMQTLSEKTRLKIPYLIGADAAHGNGLISGRTIFPTSISMAATFNRDLVKQTTTAASREIRTGGLSWIFAPSVDVVFDARWGRTGETYGESADRPSIDFYGRQTELVKALYETGKPVVAVIVNGKPLNNEWVSQNIPAMSTFGNRACTAARHWPKSSSARYAPRANCLSRCPNMPDRYPCTIIMRLHATGPATAWAVDAPTTSRPTPSVTV